MPVTVYLFVCGKCAFLEHNPPRRLSSETSQATNHMQMVHERQALLFGEGNPPVEAHSAYTLAPITYPIPGKAKHDWSSPFTSNQHFHKYHQPYFLSPLNGVPHGTIAR